MRVLLILLAAALAAQIPPGSVEEARRLFVAGQLEASVQAWRKVLAQQPESADALLGYGVALDALGRHQEAYRCLEHARRLRPESAQVLNNLAVTLVHLNRSDEALDLWDRSLRIQPGNAGALFNSGALYLARGRWTEAIARLTSLVAAGQADEAVRQKLAAAHLGAGQSLLRSGQLEASFEHFQSSIECNPVEPAPYIGAALVLIRGEATVQAIAMLEEANRRIPNQPKMLIALGYAHESGNQWEAAAEQYRKALAADPSSAVARTLLGRCLLEAGESDAGVALLREALKIEPNSPMASLELGKALLASDPGSAEGLSLIRRAAELEPGSAEPKYLLAKAAFAQQDLKQAADYARLAAAADPEMAPAHYLLSQILRKRGELVKAEAELTEFRRLKSLGSDRSLRELERALGSPSVKSSAIGH